jgi:hypothetical protein
MTSKPTTISETELQEDFDAVLDRAANGERFSIVREDGTAVVLLCYEDYLALKKAAGATSWTSTVEKDETGFFIRLPNEMLDMLGWEARDTLIWTVEGSGSVSLRKKDPAEAPDPEHEARLVALGDGA